MTTLDHADEPSPEPAATTSGHLDGPSPEPAATAVEQVDDPNPAPAGKPAWRRPVLAAAALVFAMLVGAATTFGVLTVVGLPGQPVHDYGVNIYFLSEATAEQKAAVEAKLPTFEPVGEVTFETKDAAFERYEKLRKDVPSLPEVEKDVLPESFQMWTKGFSFDCAGYAAVRHMPGVREVQVAQRSVNGYGASIICDAEYDR